MKNITHFNKRLAIAAALLGAAGLSAAQAVNPQVAPGPEYGRVLSSTAVQTAVNVPRQVCGTEQVAAPAQKSGAGAVMGGLAGGAIGNSMGQGSGRALATAVGIVGGALLGDHIEGPNNPQVQNVQRCVTQQVTEYRTTGYNIVYEYAGRQYTVQMPQDPGPWIKLQVTPAGQQGSIAPTGMLVSDTVIYAQQPQVVYAQPAVVYAPAPVYLASPVVIGASFGYARPYHHHGGSTVGVNFNYNTAYPRRWY